MWQRSRIVADSSTDGERSLDGSVAQASSESTSGHSDASDGNDPASETDSKGGLDLHGEGSTAPASMEALQALMEASEGGDVDDSGPGSRRKRRRVYSDTHSLDAQKAEWLLAADGPSVKGAPLRCLLCNGALLLNSSVHSLALVTCHNVAQAASSLRMQFRADSPPPLLPFGMFLHGSSMVQSSV
jgi:hypothetical protein